MTANHIHDRHATDTTVVEFARLGWDVSLDWRVTLRNWATFVAAMGTLDGGYNAFNPRSVVATFRELFDNAMQVEFGRESSVVMYVSVPFYRHQRQGARTSDTMVRLTDTERRDFAARVIAWAKQQHADEISVQQQPTKISAAVPDDVIGKPGPYPYRIRLWWD